ncbi:MAG: flagellar hook-basal body complex protein, partial [Firmicutes bacterium]|nr:flagellar hook-basal body complex protein [Bacillota bacterium]
MQRSLYSGVSGLRNHQTKLDVIGNNIANVNTVGFKSSRVRFQDVFSQVIRGATAPMGGRGGSNAAQVGMGMTLAAIDTLHTQGSPQYTGNPDDMAIQGYGYFVVTDGVGQYYTRDGAFSCGLDGDLVNAANGLKLLGWRVNENDEIDTSGPLTTLNIPLGDTVVSKATENMKFTGNLDADTNNGDTFETEAMVYDSQG